MQLTIDCADPQCMVAFRAEALGYVPEPAPDGHPTWRVYWTSLGVPAEELPPGAGAVPRDVHVRRVTAAVERLVAAGATVLRIEDDPGTGF